MIGKLTGHLDSAAQGHVILDVGGVGYVVHASAPTLAGCGMKGDALSLLIETHVREDAITLYGFAKEEERQWFRMLTGVQGVGAKAALSILSACPPERLGFAIASGDKAALTRADGIGPKIAMRIVTELKDKAGKIDFSSKPGAVPASAATQQPDQKASGHIDQDAVSALVNLGYARTDAYEAVARAKGKANDNEDTDSCSVESLIRLALQELSA